MARVDVVLLPEHLSERQIETDTLIVVDVLRASTTIVAALDARASSVVPMRDVDDARAYALQNPEAMLCGERGGLPPDGFTLGNSPLEYTSNAVGRRELVLSTTNGTRALAMVSASSTVLIGAVTNRDAVCERAVQDGDVTIVCAGTLGEVSLDDCLAAGAMVNRMVELGHKTSETALLVAQGTNSLIHDRGSIERALRSTLHGRRLINLGLDADIEYAARIDSSSVVPQYDPRSNRLIGG